MGEKLYPEGELDEGFYREVDGVIISPPATADRFDPESDSTTPPTAYFVVYREGDAKDGQWRIVSDVLVAHDLDELLDRVFDRYPGVNRASKVRFIEADSGSVFEPEWRQR